MGIESIAAKLDKYFGRLEDGKAKKIKPSHVQKAIDKLRTKQKLLEDERREAEKPSKIARLDKKLATVAEQITRAEWLLAKIGA